MGLSQHKYYISSIEGWIFQMKACTLGIHAEIIIIMCNRSSFRRKVLLLVQIEWVITQPKVLYLHSEYEIPAVNNV